MDKKKIILLISIILAAVIVIAAAVIITVGILGNDTPEPAYNGDGGECGTYYYSVGNTESELVLAAGGTFKLTYNGNIDSGKYSIDGGALTFDFDVEGKENATGSYENGAVVLNYGGLNMRMLKKVNYTVKFDTLGGSAIEDVTVLNGKQVAKPADPERDGFLFVGWYKDSDYKSPYTFGTDIVCGDTTVYARWIENTGAKEYTVSFDLGYDGAPDVADKTTLGGKLFALDAQHRDNYEFLGWWISTDNERDALSYEWSEETVFVEDTVLFALWREKGSTKIAPPSLKLSGSTVSWGSVSGARSYEVTVTGADGTAVLKKTLSTTSVTVSFDDLAPGVYSIKVIARANTGNADDSEAYYTYSNKELDKVTGLFVSGESTLVFEGVPNAEKYLITVVCGNSDHNHTDYDNGLSKTFSFANCPMGNDGIKFTVKAVAEGYLSSVSDEFVYKRELPAVSGLEWNESDGSVVWEAVENAEYYCVTVECGSLGHTHTLVKVSETAFDIKGCASKDGGITVKVYPVKEGYISPEPTVITVEKKNLVTPENLEIDGTVVSWGESPDADKYEISVNTQIYESTTNTFDINTALSSAVGERYEIKVRAIGEASSPWSDAVVCYFATLGGELSYSKNIVSWSYVIGAEYYEVQVNDGEIVKIVDATYATVTLDRAGENTVKVRSAKGGAYSEWIATTLVAYAVTFDTLGGSAVPTQYKTAHDVIELLASEKAGYDFISWYNVPGGPATNGKEISAETFKITENVTVYAYYTPKEYEITYNYGIGGSGIGLPCKVKYDENYTLEVPKSNEVTVSFGGWFSAPYGSGTQFTDGSGNSLTPWRTLGGAELYAFWIDQTLSFESVKVNGKNAYAVFAGPRISLVTSVTVPATHNGLPVAMINGGAFAGYKALEVINIPATIEVISNVDPFEDCPSLREINVYGADDAGYLRYISEDGVLFEKKADGESVLVRMPSGKSGEYATPDFVTEIAESAFASSSITSITVSGGVNKIGNDAFVGSSVLESVAFAPSEGTPSELIIGKRAFADCESLTGIVLPARLGSIELSKYYISPTGAFTLSADYAFVGCDSLSSIGVEAGSMNYEMYDGMIYSAKVGQLLFCPVAKGGEITLSPNTRSIGAGAFIGCENITEITIPNTVNYIGEYAFYGIHASKVTFGGNSFSSVTVGDYAFMNCKTLESVVFEKVSPVAVIGAGAFSGCESLSSFTITSSVNTIRDNAFENCIGLKTVTFEGGKNPLEFGKNVFLNCSGLTTVEIPENVTEIPGIFAGCTSLTEVKVASTNQNFTSHGGVVFNRDMTEIVYFPQGKGGEYVIPDSVSSIAAGVFSGNRVITELVIPNTVSYIGENAFRSTKIGKITFAGDEYAESLVIAKSAFFGAYFEGYDFTLPKHTKEIGDYAFSEVFYKKIILNDGLEAIGNYSFYLPSNDNGETLVIPASVRTIGEYCFSGESMDYSILTINRYFGVEFTKDDSQLISIGDYAFYKNAKLSSVSLPDSVKTIGNYAFYECTGLVSVELSESLEVIGAFAFGASANTYKVPISSIVIPKNVKAIGARAFENCQNLTTVIFEGTASSPDLYVGTAYRRNYTKDGVELFAIERGNVFASCTKLSEITLSANVTTLGDYTFASAGDVGFKVNVPDDSRLATIGAYCFYKSRLESFRVPATVRNLEPLEELGVRYDRLGIGEYAFAATSGKLSEIVFLKDSNGYPLTIGYGAFENQRWLEAIELPSRLACYASAGGEMIDPLANGALVFYGASSLAEITVSGDGYYTVLGGVLYTSDMTELVFCPPCVSGEIEVPDQTVKIHNYAFLNCDGISAVSFGDQSKLSIIGDYAFFGCESVQNIVLPSRVNSIGEGAFNNCVCLESITLSSAVESFDISVLNGCTSLLEINVPEENKSFLSEDGVLFSSDMTALILYPCGRSEEEYTVPDGVISIGASAFANNVYLASVILPEGLVEMQYGAFAGCYLLNTVVIPNSVQMIGNDAFAGTESLEYLEFAKGGESVLVIGEGAFRSSGISSAELPARLIYIGKEAFADSRLESLSFEPADGYILEIIGDMAFYATPLTSVIIPSGVTSIGNGAFANCTKLETAILGDGLVTLGESAFADSAIVSVYLPASLKTLGAYAFRGATRLTTVAFGTGSVLEGISKGAFMGCTKLTEIKVPAYVKEISGGADVGAFFGCTSLRRVTFLSGDNCTVIGDHAFFGCTSLSEFEIPLSVGTLGSYAFSGCTSLGAITVHRATTKLGTGVFAGCTSLSGVTLNTGADRLPEDAFKDCVNLTYVYIPAGITAIGNGCFEGSSVRAFEVAKENRSLISIDGVIFTAGKTAVVYFPPKSENTTLFIPKEVVEIAPSNFEGCTGIKDVIFEEGGVVPLSIGDKAFHGCYQLRSVTLPERLVSIGKYAFKECYALTSITIPKNVKEIGDFSFTWCYKLYEVRNESDIKDVGSKGAIKSANPNVNIYTPAEGESVIYAEGEFLFATVKGVKTLIGYTGNDADITLPSGSYSVADYLFYNDSSVKSITVPDVSGVNISNSSSFVGCTNLDYIYISSVSAPTSWNSSWNSKTRVVYGYTGEEITYEFVTDGMAVVESIKEDRVVTLPRPAVEGYVFLGWYDNESRTGTPVSEKYYSTEKTTLYSKFVTEEEYISDYLYGQSMEHAYSIESGAKYGVKIKNGKDQNYFVLTVSAGDVWNITTIADAGDHKIWIYDENGNEITSYDKSYRENVDHTFMEAGTYYIGIGFRGSKTTGSFEVKFTEK